MLRGLGKIVLLLVLASIAAFAGCLVLAVGDEAHVLPDEPVPRADLERVRTIFREGDPRRLEEGDVQSVTLTEQDLNLFLDYGLSRFDRIDRSVNGRIDLAADEGSLRFTWLLPSNPLGRFVNLDVAFRSAGGALSVDSIRIGRMPVPAWLANVLLRGTDWALRLREDYDAARSTLAGVALRERGLEVVYRWNAVFARRFGKERGGWPMDEDDRKRLLSYARRIGVATRAVQGQEVSIAELLAPLFDLAAARSRQDVDPRRENGAAITALAIYASGNDLHRILGGSDDESLEPKRLRLTLRGRRDLMLHFVVSATVTTSAGSGLADAVGVFKELSDSRGGSGFSFADLAADRAGVRFARMATGSVEEARLLQQRIGGRLRESDFMPPIDDLPEGIMEEDFERRYGSRRGAIYEDIERKIERRIDACFLYS